MKMTTKNLPANAFQFLAPAAIASGTETEGRTLTGVAYSGDMVTDHGYWSRLVIDLASVSVALPIPLLHAHDAGSSIGTVNQADASGGNLTIAADLFTTLDDLAGSIANKADAGFPWQLSVGIWPSSVEEVAAGSSIHLNGRVFNGPLTVFRGGRVREVSVVALGADHQTSAAVLNAGDTYPTPFINQEDSTMDLSEATARITALETQLAANQAATQEVSTLRVELEAERAARLSAEEQVKANEAKVRLDAITALSAELGANWEESAISLLKDMTDPQFNFYAAEMRSNAKPKPLPAGLNAELATNGGQDPEAEQLAAAQATLLKQVGGK